MTIIPKKGTKTYSELISCVIESLGLERVFKESKKVLIKPNFVTTKSSSEGVTTDINLVKHLVEAINAISNADIVVGESALLDTEETFKYLNVYEIGKAGCKIENFNKSEWVQVSSPFALLFKNLLIPKTAYQSDLIISVGKMKTHELTGVTLSIKNFMGLLSKGTRRYAHTHDINKGIVDIYSYFEKNKKVVAIIDGLVGLAGKTGPIIGVPVKTDCLVADTNAVRCDAAAVQLMGTDASQIKHIKLASEVLGVDIQHSRTTTDIVNFDVPLTPAIKWFGINTWLLENIFYKYPIQKDSQKCVSCKRCERICPKHLVSVRENRFSYDSSECVHCLCCVEACNTGSLACKISNGWLYLFLRKVWALLKIVRK